jgi:hypothetical protein
MAKQNSIVWRASLSSLCPICSGNHACSATSDDLYFCLRTHADKPGWIYFKDTSNGFGMFRDTGKINRIPQPSRNGHAQSKSHAKHLREAPMVEAILSSSPAGDFELHQLASMLGVGAEALQRLGVGFVPEASEQEPAHWLFPERNSAGQVVGLTRRYANGAKRQYPGSQRGLTFSPVEKFGKAAGAVVLVPEGASDVAAALTMGLAAVGRPNNLGGVERLRELLCEPRKAGVGVVILAERDQKPSGEWPGLDGAIRTAQRLADAWDAPVGYALPGEGQKDIRSWFVAQQASLCDARALKRLGKKFLDGVLKRVLLCLPTNANCEEAVRVSLWSNTTPKRNTDSLFTIEAADTFGPAAREVLLQGTLHRPCPYHGVPVLQRIDNPHHGVILGVDCRQYACRCCGPRLRSKWLIHITCKVLDTAVPLFFCTCQAGKPW